MFNETSFCHFLSHVQEQLAIPLVRPGQQAAKLAPVSFKLCILRHMLEGRDKATLHA